MFRNLYYDRRKGVMHLWETFKGERMYDTIDWVPSVFVATGENSATHRSIEGTPTKRKEFEHGKEYKDFVEMAKKTPGMLFEDNVKPEIQFLVDRTYDIEDDKIEIPDLVIYSLDIEVHKEQGFPDVLKAEDIISLISVRDCGAQKTYTWGCKPYTKKSEHDDIYIKCKDEEELLKRFLKWWYENPPDVATGWYCYNFDFPYIIRRVQNVLGKGKEAMLSPIGEVQMWAGKDGHSMNVDIAGVSIIDYHPLYKRLSKAMGIYLESYTLEVVSNHVLEKGKLDYSQEAISLSDLYHNNWDIYVDYNKIDVKRVAQIEEKCKFIQLTQILSLITRCPMKYTDAQTSLIEGAMLTWLRRNHMCAPQFKGGHKEDFPGGFVKDPKIGKYEWVFSVDIQSSYPSHIITLNMSSETLMGRIVDFNEEDVMEHTLERKFPEFTMVKEGKKIVFDGKRLELFNKGLVDKQFAVAPNGSVFMTNKKGALARFQRDYFEKRLVYKKLVKTDKKNTAYWNSLQNSIKTILNAFYGATSVPYSRYHNLDISTAITSCGRRSVQKAMEYTKERYGDIVIYGDTDSLYCHFLPIIGNDEKWNTLDREKKVQIIQKFLEQYEKVINGDIFEKVQKGYYNSNVEDFQIRFVPERICDTALFVVKKKYALFHDGKVKVKGLEIVRSDTPLAIKERLREIMNLILYNASDEEISNRISLYKKELKDVAPEEIASNIGVKETEKYTNDEDGKHVKGTPMQVKAVIYTNQLIKRFNIDHPPLDEGLKTKVAYVKRNKYEYDTIAFYRWKKEFNDIGLQIDYDKMIDKYFTKKVEFLLESMNKTNLLRNNLIDDLF